MQFTQHLHPSIAALEEASLHLKRGDHAQAILAARRATQIDPEKPNGWWLWGLAAIETYAYDDAEKALAEGARQVPEGHPLRARFCIQRARALVPLGRCAEACGMVHEALRLGADDAESLYILGITLTNCRREAEALPLLRRAVELAPKVAAYWDGLGDTEHFLGLTDDAERSYEKAVSPETSGEQLWASHLALSRLKRWTREHNHIDRLLATPAIGAYYEAPKGYSLFKEYDDIGDYASAWEWLQKGADAACRNMTNTPNPSWSAQEEKDTLEAWKACLPATRFAKLPQTVRQGPRRIFIVGLPRSGTTLVERILASHSDVQALGELQTFTTAVKKLSGVRSVSLLDAETIAAASQVSPQAFADFYDRETAYLHDGHSGYTIDKLPRNSDNLGLIRLAFPDAIIIHLRRAPMDSLFGAYRLQFVAHWSFDFASLANHYAHYAGLMRHWKSCLGASLIDVSLEAVIADPETQIRRLLDACGLPFEEACLSPHETKGAVATASSSQVRKPINAEGVGAWRRYETQLEPLRAHLEAMGFVDGKGNPV